MTRNKGLAVCFPTGQNVIAKIGSAGKMISVEVEKFGIKYRIDRINYKKSIKLLENTWKILYSK
ncbi:unnamed protein product, partial [marine sediment metagenome]